MKVINSTKYSYKGVVNDYYVFESRHSHAKDKEWIIVEQAKMIHPDGSCEYFNSRVADRLNAYYNKVREIIPTLTEVNADERVCLPHVLRPTHTPKRSVAGTDCPVITTKVIRKKEVMH